MIFWSASKLHMLCPSWSIYVSTFTAASCQTARCLSNFNPFTILFRKIVFYLLPKLMKWIKLLFIGLLWFKAQLTITIISFPISAELYLSSIKLFSPPKIRTSSMRPIFRSYFPSKYQAELCSPSMPPLFLSKKQNKLYASRTSFSSPTRLSSIRPVSHHHFFPIPG